MTSATPLVTDAEWQAQAQALAATVAEVADPQWSAAFATVPRHVFVPRFFRRDPAGDLVAIEGTDQTRRAQ